MIYNGLAIMICSAAPLAGVLHLLHHNLIKAYHARVWANPLAPPTTRIERRHIKRACVECSFVASTRTSYSAPVDTPPVRVED